jgi:branched-chain amino acid aminotransferase
MLEINWDADQGWFDPIIKPYGKISLEPSAMVFHYSFECFEGLKAYKDKEGNIRLFRPDMNMKRFKMSAARLTLPVSLYNDHFIYLISLVISHSFKYFRISVEMNY